MLSHADMEQRTYALINQAKQYHKEDRIAIYYHFQEQAATPKIHLLALSLYVHEELSTSSLNTKSYEGLFLALINLSWHSNEEENADMYKQNLDYIRPVAKQLLQSLS